MKRGNILALIFILTCILGTTANAWEDDWTSKIGTTDTRWNTVEVYFDLYSETGQLLTRLCVKREPSSVNGVRYYDNKYKLISTTTSGNISTMHLSLTYEKIDQILTDRRWSRADIDNVLQKVHNNGCVKMSTKLKITNNGKILITFDEEKYIDDPGVGYCGPGQRYPFTEGARADMHEWFRDYVDIGGNPPEPIKDLSLINFVYPNKIMLGTNYSYSFKVKSTFGEAIQSNLYAKVEFKDQLGNILFEDTDDIIPYNVEANSTKSEGDAFKATDTKITSATIKIYIEPVAGESDNNNNSLEATIPVYDPENIANLRANYYVGETNVRKSQPQITVGANVSNEAKANYTGVAFQVKVDGTVVKTFTADISGKSSKDYTTTIPTPSLGAHKITVTVNPNNNNPVELDTSDNAVTANILVYNELNNVNFKLLSYEGDKSVPKTTKTINVKVKLDNDSDRVFTGEDFVIEFNGNTYNRAATILPGTNIYSLGSVPSSMVVGSYPITITVNKNGNPVETNTNDNKITQIIQVTPVNDPPPPDNTTFKLSLLIDGQTGEYTTKSGYGIPIEVVIEAFTHFIPANNPTDAQCVSSPGGSSPLSSTKIQAIEGLNGVGFNNFNIQPGSTAKIIAKGFTFSTTPFGPKVSEMTLNLTNISGETALFRGKIYTDPMTEDSITAGKYEFTVDIKCNAEWQEQIRWWNPHQSLIYRCPHETHSGHMSSACSEASQHSHCTGRKNDCNGHRYTDYCSSQFCTGHRYTEYCGGCIHSHTSACYPLVCYSCIHPYKALECGDGDTCVASDTHKSGCCYIWKGGWEYEWIDSDFYSYDFKEMFIHQQLEGTIQIKGSMFDDDGVMINQ